MKLVLVCEFHRPFVTKSAFNQIEDEETGIAQFLCLESLLIVKEKLRTLIRGRKGWVCCFAVFLVSINCCWRLIKADWSCKSPAGVKFGNAGQWKASWC
jgi:hypothetical protein